VDNSLIVTIVIQSVLFLAAIVKIHQDVQIKLRELDIRLTAVEKQDDEIYAKLDKMMDVIQEIKIQLERKQNIGN
jgi:energy-converting hydrogenase Eha subunit H